jgi:hypothetical protein
VQVGVTVSIHVHAEHHPVIVAPRSVKSNVLSFHGRYAEYAESDSPCPA